MDASGYTKLFEGNFILITRLTAELDAVGIVPVIKDEGESQRLAGYGSMNQGFQEVYVNNEELDKAIEVLNRVKAEMQAS